MSEKREKPPRKQQQRSLRTKQKLLDAALEAFSQGGFLGTSTREIAAKAGVHHPLITYHFTNKDRLWRSAIKHVLLDFIATLQDTQERYATDDPVARFAAMVKIYVRFSAAHPALHKIILQESGSPSDRLDWLCENFLKPIADVAAVNIADLQQRGIAQGGYPVMIYNMIRVSTGGLIAIALELKNTSAIDLNSEETLDELTDLIVRLFLPGTAAAAA